MVSLSGKRVFCAAAASFVLPAVALLAAPALAAETRHTITIANMDAVTAKYELVEFMSRRSYAGGIQNFDELKFRKPVKNPYSSHLQGGGIEHNLTDEIRFEVVNIGKPKEFIVFFAFDRSDIRPSGRAVIADAMKYIRRVKATSVLVVGHADRSGSNSYNQGLSRRRADAVAAALRSQGVRVEARGETDPLVKTRDGVRHPRNRRARIIVIEAGAAKPGITGVRITAIRNFYSYPATKREAKTTPIMLWPHDPSLSRLMSKFRRYVSQASSKNKR